MQIFRPFLNDKLQELIQDKNKGFYKIAKSGTENQIPLARPLWIHAASGEIEYARPIIREYKKKNPDVPILITYTSPSAKKMLEGLGEVDVWGVLPWEFNFLMNSFIKKWNPRALLISRTDVWPILANSVASAKIPSLLFSATFAENSSRLKGFTRFLTRYTLNQLTEIHCVSEDDRKNIEDLQLKCKICVSGDTRFDQVFHRLENPKALRSELMPTPDDFVFIAGSTWPEDEKHLLGALAKLKGQLPKFIIAPHEATPAHLEHLEQQIQELGLESLRYSTAHHWSEGKILIVDQVGILAELYTWSDLAFIGGSFKKQVHSVMEALAAGVPVMVGPFHKNNREALFYQKKNFSAGMIVQVVHTSEDIVLLIDRMTKKILMLPQIKEQIRAEVYKNRNSTQRILEAL
jgi:3-deoxy-D-manno-octulosonic-acid transferase